MWWKVIWTSSRLVRAGIEAAVAPLGTALTEAQIALLWNMAPEPVLCFDGDAAGARAMGRAAERALPLLKPGNSLRFVTLPAGEDPDTLIGTSGAGVFEEMLAKARPLDQVIWDMEAVGSRLDTPERIAGLETRLEQRAFAIADRKVQYQYLDTFRKKLREFAYKNRIQILSKKEDKHLSTKIAFAQADKEEDLERSLLWMMINLPETAIEFIEEIARLEFVSNKTSTAILQVLNIFAEQNDLSTPNILEILSTRGCREIIYPLLKSNKYISNSSIFEAENDAKRNEFSKIISRLRLKHLHDEKNILAEEYSKNSVDEKLWDQLRNIIRLIQDEDMKSQSLRED